MRRWLYLLHRWLGVGLCVVLLAWFVSGIVMMYVGYPKLTAVERLQHLPPLQVGSGMLPPAEALHRAGVHGALSDLRLTRSRAGEPVYAVVAEVAHKAGGGHGARRSAAAPLIVDARTGERLGPTDASVARQSAAAYAPGTIEPVWLGERQEDAWTHSRALDAHRPLHLLQLHDEAQTRVYVSGRTGEVVRDATRTERVWNWVGAWLHWLYPFRGNRLDAYWGDIVNTLSVVSLLLVLTGATVGIWRWRFAAPYRSGRRSPYPGRLQRWHHVTGLLFAGIALTWVFSGWMSMNPWKLFDSEAPKPDLTAMHGPRVSVQADWLGPDALLVVAGSASVRELQWTTSLGRTVVQVRGPGGRVAVLDARSGAAVVDTGAVAARASRLMPHASVTAIETVTAHDWHYYSREAHTMTGGNDRPLPALRVRYDDPHATWLHLDPVTGEVITRLDRPGRVKRWLFAFLHSWDWLPLLHNRPVWDVLLIGLSLGGVCISLTGVVLGLRRVRHKLRSPLLAQR